MGKIFKSLLRSNSHGQQWIQESGFRGFGPIKYQWTTATSGVESSNQAEFCAWVGEGKILVKDIRANPLLLWKWWGDLLRPHVPDRSSIFKASFISHTHKINSLNSIYLPPAYESLNWACGSRELCISSLNHSLVNCPLTGIMMCSISCLKSLALLLR